MSFAISELSSSPLLLPCFVFVAETCVVTLSTVRTIFIARGLKVLAPALGFFEVSIWLFAIGQIMQNLSNVACYLAFAGGFTLGNFFGVLIEKKLAIGNVVVQITTRREPDALIEGLKSAEYGVTTLQAQGATGPVRVVFTVIKRKELVRVVEIIKHFDGKAFYSVNDLQTASRGIFPSSKARDKDLIPMGVRLSRSAA
jgi:uncharacterized protein YebE (UPF0316 family)